MEMFKLAFFDLLEEPLPNTHKKDKCAVNVKHCSHVCSGQIPICSQFNEKAPKPQIHLLYLMNVMRTSSPGRDWSHSSHRGRAVGIAVAIQNCHAALNG